MTFDYDVIRNCVCEPVFIETDAPVAATVKSAVTQDGREFPAQSIEGGAIVLLTASQGEELELEFCDAPCGTGITVSPGGRADSVDIKIGGELFTSYVYSDSFAKPYLGPVFGKDSVEYTRCDLTAKEHPHQRSLIIAVGDVNGIDFWNEPGGEGEERHKELCNVVSGSAYAAFTAKNLWRIKDGTPVCDEERTFTFYAQPESCRYVDIDVVFTAAYGRVVFGATKEAGPLGIRVNEAIKVLNGGNMVNSYGAQGEAQCWGRPAHWCDYTGTINGNRYGIAVFDSETNLRYPTTWHIRNYGLLAANNLFFKGELAIEEGQSLRYRYRVCFHSEGFDSTVNDRFVMYAAAEKERI